MLEISTSYLNIKFVGLNFVENNAQNCFQENLVDQKDIFMGMV